MYCSVCVSRSWQWNSVVSTIPSLKGQSHLSSTISSGRLDKKLGDRFWGFRFIMDISSKQHLVKDFKLHFYLKPALSELLFPECSCSLESNSGDAIGFGFSPFDQENRDFFHSIVGLSSLYIFNVHLCSWLTVYALKIFSLLILTHIWSSKWCAYCLFLNSQCFHFDLYLKE